MIGIWQLALGRSCGRSLSCWLITMALEERSTVHQCLHDSCPARMKLMDWKCYHSNIHSLWLCPDWPALLIKFCHVSHQQCQRDDRANTRQDRLLILPNTKCCSIIVPMSISVTACQKSTKLKNLPMHALCSMTWWTRATMEQQTCLHVDCTTEMFPSCSWCKTLSTRTNTWGWSMHSIYHAV